MFIRVKWLFHSVIVLQIMKSPPPHNYCKYGILVFDHDGTGPADESKRTKRVQGWSRQIVWGGAFHYLQYYYTVK